MKKNKFIYCKFNKDPFHTHMKLLNRVAKESSVLEIGCATGYFTRELVKKNCLVTAVEKDKKAADLARKVKGANIINCDINSLEKHLPSQKFDFIILADILEHLTDPFIALQLVKKFLKKDGSILISLPNIANFVVRLNLLFGRFDYQDYGIMDKTHLKFFTKKTAEELIDRTGLRIIFFDVVSGFEVSKIYSKTIGRLVFKVFLLRYIEYFLTRLLPNLFSLEFIYEAKIK